MRAFKLGRSSKSPTISRYKIASHLQIPQPLQVAYFQRARRSPRFFSANSFRLCRCKIPGGRGDIHSSKANVRHLSPVPLPLLALCAPPLSTIHQPPVTSHRLCLFNDLDIPLHSRNSNPCIFLRLDTPAGGGRYAAAKAKSCLLVFWFLPTRLPARRVVGHALFASRFHRDRIANPSARSTPCGPALSGPSG